MSELKPCPFCGIEIQPDSQTGEKYPHKLGGNIYTIYCECCGASRSGHGRGNIVSVWNTRPIEDELQAEIEKRTAELHYANTACMEMKRELDRLKAELKYTDDLLKEATETIGSVIACCTYDSNDDAKIGIYGIDHKSFTRIDQFITHYNDAVSAGKVSVDVKRELSDAEITRLENRFADTEACNGRLVEQVEQLTAENKRLKAVLNEWDMAWLTDCIAPQPNGNGAFGLDEGLVLCARMMKPILEETRLLLGKAEVVR